MIEQNKLLLEKINQNILNLNNFKNFNEKSISDDELYYQNLTDFYFFVNKQNNSLPKSNNEHFSNNSVSDYQVKEINKIYNPIIDNLNQQLIKKTNEYNQAKIKFYHINNYLDKNIENFEYVYNNDKLIEPFIKGAVKSVSKVANKAASTVSNTAQSAANAAADAAKRAADAARRAAEEAAEAARRAAELLKKKIEEAINKVRNETNGIKKIITDKLKSLNKILDMIKKIRDEIVQIQKKIISSVRDAYTKSNKIMKELPNLYKKILSEKSKQADINYKKAASIKNNAINNAKKELDKAYVEARRIKAQNKKDSIIDKDEPLDNSDYELSAADANKDLDMIKNATKVELPKPKPDVSPFILVFIIIGVIFILSEFVLPPLK